MPGAKLSASSGQVGGSPTRTSIFRRLLGLLKGGGYYFTDPDGVALAHAIENSDTKPNVVKKVAEKGVSLDVRGHGGITPLLYAVIRSKLNGFVALLELGADPNLKADNGEGVMSMAAIHPNPDFLRA